MQAMTDRVRNHQWAMALCAPLLLLLVHTLLTVRYGLNLADEGFLWYGAQRSATGEVPLRDFSAYDPGRYYWTALWMWLSRDDGIIVMRWSAILFESIAVGVTTLAVLRRSRSVLVSALAGVCCVLLMNLWHARFEPSIALLQAVVLARLLEKADDARFFAGGLQVGLSAIFGRNLALYGLIGMFVVLAMLTYVDRHSASLRRLSLVAAGGLVGALPLLAMLIFVPGFASAFWESIIHHFELGATNLPLPFPWPWALRYEGQPWSIVVAMFLHALLQFTMVLLGPCVVAWTILRNPNFPRTHSLFTAAVLLAIPYAQYAFSRADTEHLIRAGAPLILALAIFPITQLPRWRALPAFLLAAVLVYVHPLHMSGVRVLGVAPSVSPANWLSERTACQVIAVGGDELCVRADVARIVEGARTLVDRFGLEGQSVLITPFHPGLYAALGLRAPVWEIYALAPAQPLFEAAEIRRIEAAGTRLAIVSRIVIDGPSDLHFRATHPMITDYLSSRYEVLQQAVLPPAFDVLVKLQPDAVRPMK